MAAEEAVELRLAAADLTKRSIMIYANQDGKSAQEARGVFK